MRTYSLSHIRDRLKQDSPARFLERIATTVRVNARDLAWDSYFSVLRLAHPDGFALRPVQGGKLYLDLRDKGITRELFFKGIREPEATRFTQQILREGQTVFDVGANIGYYVLIESMCVGPRGRIIAVEPVPGNVQLCRRNIEVNQLQNVELHECAIGDAEGHAEMYVTDKSNWSSMHKSKYANVVRSIQVPVHTLDGFLEGRPQPDFIRMDVEGYESKIIEGMRGFLASRRPVRMFVELHPHIMKAEDVAGMLRTLHDAGFAIERFFGKFPMADPDIRRLIEHTPFVEGATGAAYVFFRRA